MNSLKYLKCSTCMCSLTFENIAQIACKTGHFVSVQNISMFGAPNGQVLVNFFNKTFRISYWHLVEQL